jgi:hypothetical protein
VEKAESRKLKIEMGSDGVWDLNRRQQRERRGGMWRVGCET